MGPRAHKIHAYVDSLHAAMGRLSVWSSTVTEHLGI